jgi:MoaA/NifB/PqqE/SkfB family radical SAM enzyme
MIGRKHLDALFRYATARKIINLVRCEVEKRCRLTRTGAMPFTATIDVTNLCNLSCPFCPTGAGYMRRQRMFLDLSLLRKFLDEAGPYLFIAHLYNWGETLLHPEAPQIVREVRQRRIATSVSTNLNIKDDTVLERICEAGVDHVIASVDGASQATYEKYRVQGDFELVLRNLRTLVTWKRIHRTRRPWIDWQFLVFEHNRHELDEARRIAADIGVDGFKMKTPTVPGKRRNFYGSQNFCGLLWHNITLQADGGLAPCCNLFAAKDDFGHIAQLSVREMRANRRNVEARSIFTRSPPDSFSEGHPCLRCPIVRGLPHLQEIIQAAHGAVPDEKTMATMEQ